MSFVADTSVVLSWCFPEELTAHSQQLLRRAVKDGIYVPAVWSFEVSNGLGLAERTGRIDAGLLTRAFAQLEMLHTRVEQPSGAQYLADLVSAMRQHGVTAYDAAFLLLSHKLRLPLATYDRRLAFAAARNDVQLL